MRACVYARDLTRHVQAWSSAIDRSVSMLVCIFVERFMRSSREGSKSCAAFYLLCVVRTVVLSRRAYMRIYSCLVVVFVCQVSHVIIQS